MHPVWFPPVNERKKPEPPSAEIEEKPKDEGHDQDDSEACQDSPFPPLPPDYQAMSFPSAVEQQYEETLRALPLGNPPLASNLQQAEALVVRLEKRYAPRVSKIKIAFDLNPPSSAERKQSASGKQMRLAGQMETISEDAEIGVLPIIFASFYLCIDVFVFFIALLQESLQLNESLDNLINYIYLENYDLLPLRQNHGSRLLKLTPALNDCVMKFTF